MFELLPGTGLGLPRGAGVVRFGASERAAQWAVATLADVREGWVCGAGWAFGARYEGVELHAYGDTADRLGRTGRDRGGFAGVELRRCPAVPVGPAAVPVVLRGIDVFGYPAAEVLDALGPDPHPAVRWHAERSPGGYLTAVRLLADR
ncbi:hypothetical protein [Kitasatospora terrestris]|uniref:Uncharacterized protein n=1 Tax=Kitasatospora terrestris TaxID=258051 RepID=A0ABP9DDW4_9ACTN